MKTIKIGGKKIGGNEPVFIVAEAGVNHNGELERAKDHIRLAKEAGCDAIKFQNYTAERLVTKKAPKYWHVGPNDGKTQYETFSVLDELPENNYQKMMDYAKEIGIILFSTPFELEAVDLLEDINVPAYKIASADIIYFPLLSKVAKTGKPIIMSTGAATIGEIEEAVNFIKKCGNDQIILLHCILSYPTAADDANLLMIDSLRGLFPEIPIGFSDHTFSPLTPAFAVMRGARIVEKHFTTDKTLPDSPDHQLGVDPAEMKQLVDAVRLAEESLGKGLKEPVESEMEAQRFARRSVTSLVDIKKDTKITKDMLIGKRPGMGIPPKFIDIVVGRKAKADIPADTTITWDLI
ncbi:MAG: N-acetylneuraminate synthase family protein [Candidatus Curtissbacteria bacterium]|nr:N-acetylneuraminate synthase family protein [Candidatus Curtissbacteria bacterium]